MGILWPNHRSHPIFGTQFYRWTLWIEGDPDDLDKVTSVRYNLHPTFERGYAESSDRGFNFRIDAQGWGSFYVDVRIRYRAGFEERVSYFLDINQFFASKIPQKLKQFGKSVATDEELATAYADGYRDFSGVRVLPSQNNALMGASFVGADFSDADFTGISLAGVNLARTNLSRALLIDTDLSGANLTMARLTESDMSGSVLHAVNRTNWIVSDVRASHVFFDHERGRRIPVDRDFEPYEFEQWLKSIPEMEDILPPETRTVFISYNWKDEKAALAIKQWLKDHGVRVIIDREDFMVSNDLFEAIVQAVESADKVLVLYSANSASQPYTKLERRIAEGREAEAMVEGIPIILLIYVCLDDTELPTESKHRIAIKAAGHGFLEVCERIYAAIMERRYEGERYDWKPHIYNPPW